MTSSSSRSLAARARWSSTPTSSSSIRASAPGSESGCRRRGRRSARARARSHASGGQPPPPRNRGTRRARRREGGNRSRPPTPRCEHDRSRRPRRPGAPRMGWDPIRSRARAGEPRDRRGIALKSVRPSATASAAHAGSRRLPMVSEPQSRGLGSERSAGCARRCDTRGYNHISLPVRVIEITRPAPSRPEALPVSPPTHKTAPLRRCDAVRFTVRPGGFDLRPAEKKSAALSTELRTPGERVVGTLADRHYRASSTSGGHAYPVASRTGCPSHPSWRPSSAAR